MLDRISPRGGRVGVDIAKDDILGRSSGRGRGKIEWKMAAIPSHVLVDEEGSNTRLSTLELTNSKGLVDLQVYCTTDG